MTFNMQDLNDTKAHTGSRTVPDAGDYPVMISKAGLEDNKRRDGTNAVMEYTIIGNSPFAGVVLKEWFSVVNKNETAQNISRGKLKAVQVVTKSTAVQHVSDLVGKSMIVRINKVENEYVDNNGQTRKGFNNEVLNYMTTDRKNAEGKEVLPFVASTEPVKSTSTSQKVQSSTSNTSGGSIEDDDIPF